MVLSMNGLLLVVVTVASISIAHGLLRDDPNYKKYCPDKCHCPIFYPHDTEPENSPVQEYPRPVHPRPIPPRPEHPRPIPPRPEHPRPIPPRPRPEHPRPIPPRPEHPRPIPPRPEHPRPQYPQPNPGNTNTDVKNQHNCNNQQTGSGLVVIGIQGLLDPCINTQ